MEDDSWNLAACADEDPELFFPIARSGNEHYAEQVAAAKRVCGRCAIETACLSWALESGQTTGVWGGASEHERRAMVRSRRQNSLPEE